MLRCLNWHMFKLFVLSFVAFVALDCLWICYLMKGLYRDNFSPFADMSSASFFDPRFFAALAVWALIVKGIIIFVLPRTHGSYSCALLKGGLYGLILYGSYQLTNFIILPEWPSEMMHYDILWGVFICAVITAFSLYAAHLCGCGNIYGDNGKGKNACL